jgi:hypothetical protein
LKHVQAQLANGNLQARAELVGGALLPLAGSLNLMAERLMRLGQASAYTQRLLRSLSELSIALEHAPAGAPFVVPASCREFVEINRLLVALRSKNRHLAPSFTQATPPTSAPHAAPANPVTPQPLMSRPGTEPLAGRHNMRLVSGSAAGRAFPASQVSGPLRASAPAQSTPASGMRPLPAPGPLPAPLQSIRRTPPLKTFEDDR